MDFVFELKSAGVPDGKRVDFGPFDQETGTQQSIPVSLTRKVVYPDLEVSALVKCVFTGDKLEIESITVMQGAKFVSTKVLTQLALPGVIREIAIEVIPNAQLWANPGVHKMGKPQGPAFLAQVYWFEHVSWGSPRGSIMNYMSWSRTNANFHISKLARQFGLPGSHAKARTKSSN